MEMINGFVCKTCNDVDYAKKNIDPAHPQDGVVKSDGRSERAAQADKAEASKAAEAPRSDRAVHFSGALANLNATSQNGWSAPGQPPQRAGDILDVVA